MPNRKKIRFENYDYSDFGVYYITVCTKDKQRIFWTNKTFSAYKVLGDAGIAVGADIIRPLSNDRKFMMKINCINGIHLPK